MGRELPRVMVIGLNYVPEPTGIAPYTAGLASGLAAAGWNVSAITAFPHYPAWSVAEGYVGRRLRERIDGVEVLRLRPYIPANPTGVRRMFLELSFGFASAFTSWGKPDVVVLVSPALFAVAIAQLRARLLPGSPAVIIWVQDIYSLGVSETAALGSRGARIMKKIESTVLGRADLVVAIHDRFKRYMTSSLGVKASAIEVVRNWTHIVPVEVDRGAYRTKFGWGSEIVVLHAGNMGAKQALENVIEAAKLADLSGANLKFVLLGNGNQRAGLISSSVGTQRIEFLDSLNDEDFQGAMAAADILLVNEKPGVTEMAVPSKLTSYFLARRPVIVATDEGSITAEEVKSAGAGIRVDAGDPQALLDAVLALGDDAPFREILAENGAEFQRQLLSRSKAISHYAELISNLASSSVRQV